MPRRAATEFRTAATKRQKSALTLHPYDGGRTKEARFVLRNMGAIWEIDFYSRPILDEQEKKRWEVLICESPLETRRSNESLFRFSKFCAANEVNSIWLGNAIKEASYKAPAPPTKIRFFRRQMTNMITKACGDLGIAASPSRRTVTLHRWLLERMQDFYPNQPGYQASAAASASVRYETPKPLPLPDALLGDRWAFVTLEAGAFDEMHEWDISFGEAFPLRSADASVSPIAPETAIPGFIVFSNRAVALAGWMSGLELAYLKVDGNQPARLILETGASESWILANLPDRQTEEEALKFESGKQKAQNLHFIAVQSSPQSESFAGFWLLQELNLA
jgi:hypothetical protein